MNTTILTRAQIKEGAKEGWADIRSLPYDTFFKKTATAKTVFVRQGYNAFSKRFDCLGWDTDAEAALKGDKLVFINFEY
tara:strand:+ start:668 stop:904 length:237 start_codon:yes stop_codon:yes gene_type:complete